jgi:hypothetical protein
MWHVLAAGDLSNACSVQLNIGQPKLLVHKHIVEADLIGKFSEHQSRSCG